MAAVVTIKSTAISNRDATPVLPTGASISGGMPREYEGYVTAAAASSANSYFPMCSVPSNMRISSVKIQSAAQGTSCTVNVGVFVPTLSNTALLALSSAYVSAAAINATLFASTFSVATTVGVTDITNQAGNNTIANQELELWQAAGLASDPGCMLDIGIQVAVATVAGGLIGLKVSGVM